MPATHTSPTVTSFFYTGVKLSKNWSHSDQYYFYGSRSFGIGGKILPWSWT